MNNVCINYRDKYSDTAIIILNGCPELLSSDTTVDMEIETVFPFMKCISSLSRIYDTY